MAAPIEKAKADDPKELGKRIAALENQLKTPSVDLPRAERVDTEREVFDERAMDHAQDKMIDELMEISASLQIAMRSAVHRGLDDYRGLCRERVAHPKKTVTVKSLADAPQWDGVPVPSERT